MPQHTLLRMADTLQPFPDDWSRALCIAAHPDDLEYGTASAVAAWTRAGKAVSYLLVTSGEAGIDSIDPAECGPIREAEERAGAAEVGVEDLEFLRYPDGVVEYGPPLRRALAGAIRRSRPDLVVCTNAELRPLWGGIDQADAKEGQVGPGPQDELHQQQGRQHKARERQSGQAPALVCSPRRSCFVHCHSAHRADRRPPSSQAHPVWHHPMRQRGAAPGCDDIGPSVVIVTKTLRTPQSE